jgi:hypothetical protein
MARSMIPQRTTRIGKAAAGLVAAALGCGGNGAHANKSDVTSSDAGALGTLDAGALETSDARTGYFTDLLESPCFMQPFDTRDGVRRVLGAR